MNLEIVTPSDIQKLKIELLESISSMINGKSLSPKTILTNEEVMDLLGVGATTLFTYRKKGLIKYSKVLGSLYYKFSDIVEFIDNAQVDNQNPFKRSG